MNESAKIAPVLLVINTGLQELRTLSARKIDGVGGQVGEISHKTSLAL